MRRGHKCVDLVAQIEQDYECEHLPESFSSNSALDLVTIQPSRAQPTVCRQPIMGGDK